MTTTTASTRQSRLLSCRQSALVLIALCLVLESSRNSVMGFTAHLMPAVRRTREDEERNDPSFVEKLSDVRAKAKPKRRKRKWKSTARRAAAAAIALESRQVEEVQVDIVPDDSLVRPKSESMQEEEEGQSDYDDEDIAQALEQIKLEVEEETTPEEPAEARGKEVQGTTIMNSLPTLFKMSRPSNFMGVVLFHLMGILTVVRHNPGVPFLKMLATPTSLLTLSTLILTSSASMLVNDYFDAIGGIDDTSNSNNLIAKGKVSKKVVKSFVSILNAILYATLLINVVFLPGTMMWSSVILGSMLTILYTQYIKPMTWLKNTACAMIVANAPLTSALAMQAALGGAASNANLWLGGMGRLVATLFFGILGREICMDINDYEGDKLASIQTIPVTYGCRIASHAVFWCTIIMALICNVRGPVLPVGMFQWVKKGLGLAGSAAMIRRALEVRQMKRRSTTVVSRAIEESKLTMLSILASFI